MLPADPRRRGLALARRLARADALYRQFPGGPTGRDLGLVRDAAARAVRRHQAEHGPITWTQGRQVWRLDPATVTEDRPTGLVARLIAWLGGPFLMLVLSISQTLIAVELKHPDGRTVQLPAGWMRTFKLGLYRPIHAGRDRIGYAVGVCGYDDFGRPVTGRKVAFFVPDEWEVVRVEPHGRTGRVA